MKKHVPLLLLFFAPVLFTNCLIDDLTDAIEEALGEEGDQACENVVQGMIAKMDSCSEEGYLKEGETAESLAAEWCSENCDDIDDEVELDDYANCATGIDALSCEDIEGETEQVKTVSGCGWLTSVLEC